MGGLFIDIHLERFPQSLRELTGVDTEPNLRKMEEAGIFNAFEKGLLNNTEFLMFFAKYFGEEHALQAYADCWNAMLGDMQLAQLQWIQPFRKHFNVVLLSNTNNIHVDALESAFALAHGYQNLEPFFDKVYYSQHIGLRKPELEIFDFVLQQNAFVAEESLFIDDTPGHLDGAKALGINTLLHPRNAAVSESLSGFKEKFSYS